MGSVAGLSTERRAVAPTPIGITLTWAEMYFAGTVALRIRLECMRRGQKHKNNAPEAAVNWDSQIFSYQGELAVCKYLNLFWSGMSDFIKAVDVGGELGAEVRTRRKFWYELILQDDDKTDRPHVLVTTEAPPFFRLVGWTYGRDGIQDKYWKDPAGDRPAYFVPHNALRPMAELKQILGGPAYVEKGAP